MLPAAKRGPHTNGPSPPNGRSTPVVRKLADDSAASSGHERQCVYVTRLDRREVAAIKRCDGVEVESFGEHDDGSVDDAQREIRVRVVGGAAARFYGALSSLSRCTSEAR